MAETMEIKIIDLETFIKRCYLNISQSIRYKTALYYDRDKNLKEIISNINCTIRETINDLVPIGDIINSMDDADFLDSDSENETTSSEEDSEEEEDEAEEEDSEAEEEESEERQPLQFNDEPKPFIERYEPEEIKPFQSLQTSNDNSLETTNQQRPQNNPFSIPRPIRTEQPFRPIVRQPLIQPNEFGFNPQRHNQNEEDSEADEEEYEDSEAEEETESESELEEEDED